MFWDTFRNKIVYGTQLNKKNSGKIAYLCVQTSYIGQAMVWKKRPGLFTWVVFPSRTFLWFDAAFFLLFQANQTSKKNCWDICQRIHVKREEAKVHDRPLRMLEYRPYYKTLPRSSAFGNWISVRFYETDCILYSPPIVWWLE